MALDMDNQFYSSEQGSRCRKLFAAVVLAVLDDAVKEERERGTGAASIASWARSRDGRLVLSNAGIDPNERSVSGLVAFVERGQRAAAA